MASAFPFQVEIELPQSGADDCMAAMTGWLSHWEIEAPHQPSSAGTRRLTRFAFEDRRFARAFQTAFGGTFHESDDVLAAMNADQDEEDRYERLCRSYPD